MLYNTRLECWEAVVLEALFVCSQVELVNIGGTDIVDGNHKLTLGLLWSIILHWQVGTSNHVFT